MSEYLKSFLVGFCKVEAVCFEGDPNWLGWILIGILVIVLVIVLIIIWALLEGLWGMCDEWARSLGGDGVWGSILYGSFILVSVFFLMMAFGLLVNFLFP